MSLSNIGRELWLQYLRRLLRCPGDIPVCLATRIGPRCLFAAVDTYTLWRRTSIAEKFLSICKLKWFPSDRSLRDEAKEAFYREVFGTESDFGPSMFEFTSWHQSQEWKMHQLNEIDNAKAKAIANLAVLTRIRLGNAVSIPSLNLQLARRIPTLMPLPISMAPKVHVISLQYFLDIDAEFTFSSIRQCNHKHANELISYLYEILFLQMKTATGIHEYLRLASFVLAQKKDAQLLNAEVNAIMGADSVFSYLKASIEKIVAFTGLIFDIANLDTKKSHAKKLALLQDKIGPTLEKTPYGAFLLEFIDSDNLAILNNYRTGLLHKKGVGTLQPHNYVNKGGAALPFKTIFDILHDQHAKNTTLLLCTLALLTDKLVELDPPEISLIKITKECPIYAATLFNILERSTK